MGQEVGNPLLPYLEPYASSEGSGETALLLENAISKVSKRQLNKYRLFVELELYCSYL